MNMLQDFVESRLARGRAYFSKAEALDLLKCSSQAFQSAVTRLTTKGRVISLRHGFYLISRPEDRVFGAPDPARWIDPLMRHTGLRYRVSLLRAAAFHGASHQAAMVFQVIAPRQLQSIKIGRQQVEFVYQSASHFDKANRPEWLAKLKSDAGFAIVAGVELVLLDFCRYFHRAGGINGAAQAIHDLGKKADPRILSRASMAYENSTARRLGYLLERFGHLRQAVALEVFAKQAKSFKELDPSAQPISAALAFSDKKDPKWKLSINVPVEIDD